MAYNEKLAERIRAEVEGLSVLEKKMFGGVGYMLNGNMACGILGDDMIVRTGMNDYEELLNCKHTKIFAMNGSSKPMKGWLMVEPDGWKSTKQLNGWVKIGIEFASTLPPK
ncbi:MAG TPA: TfoX/Sxy family protein [Anaerolineales bacterium]|nr:TfoX/Sxy family protein [Anaerolineales bacterium]